MALDQPPLNRAARRAAAHKKSPTLVRPPRAPRPPSPSRSAAPGPATGTGDPSDADDLADLSEPAPSPFAFMGGSGGGDSAPARKASHHKGSGKQQRIYEGLVSYYGFAGMLISTRSPADGFLIAGEAEHMATLWLDAGKASPAIMRVLELITVAGPYTALIFAHGQIAFAIMNNHGVSPLSLFARADTPPGTVGTSAPSDGQRTTQPAPLPYQPVGPFAPTDTASPFPTPPADDTLRVYPEEGLPADLDVALRQAARQSGRPYSELRDQALLELAQLRMGQNGHVQSPGALGAPVAKE